MSFCTNCQIDKAWCPKAKVRLVETDRKTLPRGIVVHGDYQIYGVIGTGGMSVTYCACTRLKPVALKQFCPTEENKKNVNIQKAREAFIEEAQRLLCINHPHVVKIENILADSNNVFLVMEYLRGESLQSYLDRTNRVFSEQHTYNILRNIFDALEVVHREGIIHRDVKPSNIMLCGVDQTIKLIDFGNARSIGAHTRTVNVSGGYAPQEQYNPHGEQGTWTDVYALSAVIYRMITGKEPQPSWQRCIEDDMRAPSGMKYGAALMKGLALEPKDRWQTVGQLRTALGNLQAGVRKPLDNHSEEQTQDSSYDRPTEYVRDSSWDRETQHVPRTAEEMKWYGDRYRNGIGVKKDSTTAFDWYQKAAQIGNVVAMSALGRAIGTAKDKKAFYWYKKAAEAEDTIAMNNLGNYYADAGTAKDNAKAFYWFKKAAEAENTIAMYNLGRCYERAIGTARDKAKAFYWYKKAAEAGDMDGMINLSRCYKKGIGTQKSWKEVRRWSKKVAEMKVESE